MLMYQYIFYNSTYLKKKLFKFQKIEWTWIIAFKRATMKTIYLFVSEIISLVSFDSIPVNKHR